VILLATLLLVGGFYALLPTLSSLPALHAWIAARLERATAWQIGFEQFRIHHDLSITLSSLSAAQPGRSPFLTADRMQVSLDPLGVLSGRGVRIRLDAPHLYPAELPAGPGGSGSLFERAELIGAFVHFPADQPDAALGPLSLTVDSALGAADQLSLSGRAQLADDSASLSWSAEIAPTLEQSHGSFELETASPLETVRQWTGTVMPPSVSPTAATLRGTWHGTAAGEIAIDVDSTWKTPVTDGLLRFAGTGTINLTEGAVGLQLAGTQPAIRSADASRAAEGIDVRVKLDIRRAGEAPRIDFDFAVPAGELLWDRVYVDLRRHPLVARGRLDVGPTQLALSRATLSIGGIATARGNGSYDPARAKLGWRAEFELPNLATAYQVALREPRQDEYPVLARLAVGGRVTGTIEQESSPSGAWHLTGFLDLDGVTLAASDPRFSIATLDAHLPVDLSDGAARSTGVQNGTIRVSGLTVGDAAVGDIAIPLRVETNQVDIADPVRVALLGGSLEVPHLRASELTSPDAKATLGLTVQDLDLAEVARAFRWPAMTGRMVGTIPALTVDRHHAESEGEIRVDVFGGTMRLRNLRVDELFSPVPALRLDLDVADLSLAQLTDTLEVGRISGVIAGSVHELEIANGQPARFDARIETVPRPDVPQRISVTAIRQLSILGGAGGDPISTRVLSLFDEYRYAKMGFHGRLENDRFTLQGVKEDDGAEYLVVGTTLPPRVNVISHTRVISFSELVNRLARVLAIKDTPTHTESTDAAQPDNSEPH
jgi:hypothetical protein